MYRSIFQSVKNARPLREQIQSRRYSNTVWNRYCAVVRDNPLAAKSVVAGFLFLTSDVICQSFFGVDEYDFWRTARFTLVGTGFTPSLHIWYAYLGRRFAGTSLLPTLQRLALDQLVFAPLFIPAFFSANLVLQGRPELIMAKIRNDWVPTVIANYAVWVPAQFINFRFVPQIHQVLFSNSVGFFWNIYMSAITYKEETVNVAKVSDLTPSSYPPLVEPTAQSASASEPIEYSLTIDDDAMVEADGDGLTPEELSSSTIQCHDIEEVFQEQVPTEDLSFDDVVVAQAKDAVEAQFAEAEDDGSHTAVDGAETFAYDEPQVLVQPRSECEGDAYFKIEGETDSNQMQNNGVGDESDAGVRKETRVE